MVFFRQAVGGMPYSAQKAEVNLFGLEVANLCGNLSNVKLAFFEKPLSYLQPVKFHVGIDRIAVYAPETFASSYGFFINVHSCYLYFYPKGSTEVSVGQEVMESSVNLFHHLKLSSCQIIDTL